MSAVEQEQATHQTSSPIASLLMLTKMSFIFLPGIGHFLLIWYIKSRAIPKALDDEFQIKKLRLLLMLNQFIVFLVFILITIFLYKRYSG
jgi:hypothetical protein